MDQKRVQKNYKNKTNNPIFDYEKEINDKRENNKDMKKKTIQNKKKTSKKSSNFDDDYFIGMNNNEDKYENNREVRKKIKKLKEKEKNNKRKKQMKKNIQNTERNQNSNTKKEQSINKKKKNEKQKQINKLNKKLLKEQKKKQYELKRIEKIEDKKRKQEKLKNLSPKELRKRKIRKVAIKYSFVLVLSIFAIILFLLSPVFYIKNIEVDGNSKISSEEIKTLLQINSTTNIFEESNSKVNEKLKENKYIDKANVSRILPSTLKVNVVEREVEYLLEYANSYAYTDINGNILEISSNSIDGKVKILGYSTKNLNEHDKLEENDIKKLNNIKNILQSAEQFGIRDKITSINIADENDYQIYCETEKKIVHLGDTKDIDTKMIYIKAILEKEKENDGEIFVNMDLNNKKPYFRQNV